MALAAWNNHEGYWLTIIWNVTAVIFHSTKILKNAFTVPIPFTQIKKNQKTRHPRMIHVLTVNHSSSQPALRCPRPLCQNNLRVTCQWTWLRCLTHVATHLLHHTHRVATVRHSYPWANTTRQIMKRVNDGATRGRLLTEAAYGHLLPPDLLPSSLILWFRNLIEQNHHAFGLIQTQNDAYNNTSVTWLRKPLSPRDR